VGSQRNSFNYKKELVAKGFRFIKGRIPEKAVLEKIYNYSEKERKDDFMQ
jgi:hypothetical protein